MVVPRANIPNFGETVFDPLVTLGVVAGATTRVQLGTTVLIVPYRNAVVTAKMVSSLDALSGGRVVLGIGAGWVAAESAMLGVPFAERGPMTDEHLRAMQELWTSPTPSFAGRYTQFADMVFEPKPHQKPHPPIWVGGHSRAALRRAVEFGAAWHPINRPPDELRAGRAELANQSAARGRAVAAGHHHAHDVRILSTGQSAPSHACRTRPRRREPAALVDQITELAECASSTWSASSWPPTAPSSRRSSALCRAGEREGRLARLRVHDELRVRSGDASASNAPATPSMPTWPVMTAPPRCDLQRCARASPAKLLRV